ncbi:MAG: HEXXH motif-containing putative peptide modification protein [Alphaproteobacteria bacterium]
MSGSPAYGGPHGKMPAALAGFRPSAARAAGLDRVVRSSFASSIAAVLRPFAAQGATDEATIARVAAAVRDGSAGPGVFVAYASLVDAVFADDGGGAAAALTALVAAPCPAITAITAPRWLTLDDHDLGPGQAARYLALFDDDPGSPVRCRAASAGDLARVAALGEAAMAALAAADASLAAEIATFAREVVIVDGTGGADGFLFHGVSSFHAWGALLLNGTALTSRLDMIQTLAHETGHTLLHGLTLGASTVDNPPGERLPSPLREGARPLDGIVHAAYVSARMELCLRSLLAADVLSPDERATAVDASAGHRRNWSDALATIDAHARFTPAGAAAFAPARAWMAETAGG